MSTFIPATPEVIKHFTIEYLVTLQEAHKWPGFLREFVEGNPGLVIAQYVPMKTLDWIEPVAPADNVKVIRTVSTALGVATEVHLDDCEMSLLIVVQYEPGEMIGPFCKVRPEPPVQKARSRWLRMLE